MIGSLSPKDKLHLRSVERMRDISSASDVFVPTVSLMEADLILKTRGYTESERETSWQGLAGIIPEDKVIPSSPSSILAAIPLQRGGMDYFDSLLASLAKETGSTVVTTDKEIGRVVDVEW